MPCLLSACVVKLLTFFEDLSETACELPWTFLFLVAIENILSDSGSADAARSQSSYQATVGALVGVEQAGVYFSASAFPPTLPAIDKKSLASARTLISCAKIEKNSSTILGARRHI